MKFLAATGAATLYGISLRLAFGTLNSIMPIMSVSFLILAPVVVGFITVLIYMRYKKANALGAFFLPWITTFLLLIATIYLNLEGSICWLMIYPLFSIAAGIGGLFAHRIMRKRKINQANSKDILDENQWNDRLKVSAVLVLPIIFGIIESDHSLNRSDITIERSVTINKPSTKIWKALTSSGAVLKEEKDGGLSSLIGFPKHVETTLDTLAIGGKRVATYERGLYFNETITDLIPNKKLVLKVDVDPHKIPPTVMDEHILIGGKHVDVYEDVYTLKANKDGSTTVSLSSHFMINTPFNWYTKIWANFLMKDILDGQLELVTYRANH